MHDARVSDQCSALWERARHAPALQKHESTPSVAAAAVAAAACAVDAPAADPPKRAHAHYAPYKTMATMTLIGGQIAAASAPEACELHDILVGCADAFEEQHPQAELQ